MKVTEIEGTQAWVAQAIAHADAQGRLLRIAEHMAPKDDPGCDSPVPNADNWDEGISRCGGCWPCMLSQLRQAVDEVKRTAVTFSELEAAAST